MKIIKFKPTYKKDDGLTVVNEESVSFPQNFLPKTRSVVIFPPDSKGGNHKHPRTEAFYSTGDLNISWKEDGGQAKEESMSPIGEEYLLFVTTPNEPHAIVNKTKLNIVLVEFADGEQTGVENVNLL